jgi:hypothetical protein
MVSFEVTAEEAVLIDGIGEFEAGETKVVTPEEAEYFRVRHGYSLAEANFPESVTVSVISENDEEPNSEVEKDEGGE